MHLSQCCPVLPATSFPVKYPLTGHDQIGKGEKLGLVKEDFLTRLAVLCSVFCSAMTRPANSLSLALISAIAVSFCD